LDRQKDIDFDQKILEYQEGWKRLGGLRWKQFEKCRSREQKGVGQRQLEKTSVQVCLFTYAKETQTYLKSRSNIELYSFNSSSFNISLNKLEW
jgi:hypothetical protein